MKVTNTPSYAILIKILKVSNELKELLNDDWKEFQKKVARVISFLDDPERKEQLNIEVKDLIRELFEGPAEDFVRSFLTLNESEWYLKKERVPKVPGDLVILGGEVEAKSMLKDISEKLGYIEFPVFFATDREESPGSKVSKRFTGDRGDLSLGIMNISIPLGHKKGDIEGPKWWKLQFKANPKKHITLLNISTMDRTDFVTSVRDAVGNSDSRDALIFIHGYNVDFESAALRTAQIGYDLQFKGQSFLYSWPSKGSLLGYGADAAAVEWTLPHFEEFLRLVMTEIEVETVNIIAHSMGNRALTRVLEQFDPAKLPQGSARLRQIVLAAPDVDREIFEQLTETFDGRSERITLYASENDLAMKASSVIHQFERAGDVEDTPVVVNFVDSIDASEADTSLFGLGHSYVGDKRNILADVFDLIHHNTEPDDRFGLEKEMTNQGPYWRFLP